MKPILHKMFKYALTTALVAGGTLASPAMAKSKTVTYSFTGYCDGITFTPGTGTAPTLGQHIFDQTTCVAPNENLGGFPSSLKQLGSGKWYTLTEAISSSDPYDPQSFGLVWYINTAALTWDVYYVSTDNSVPYGLLNSGTLTVGAPPALHAPGRIHSAVDGAAGKIEALQHNN